MRKSHEIQIRPEQLVDQKTTPHRIASIVQLSNMNVEKSFEDDHLNANYALPQCDICWDLIFTEKTVPLSCRHNFCLDCITRYVEGKLRDRILNIKCPNPDCLDLFSFHFLENFLRRHGTTSNLIERISLHHGLYQLPFRFQCPTPNCSNIQWDFREPSDHIFRHRSGIFRLIWWKKYQIDDLGKDKRKFSCSLCRKSYCLVCKAPFSHNGRYHDLISCEKYKKIHKSSGDPDDQKMISRLRSEMKAKQCPQCGVIIQKIGGCSRIRCTMCQSIFCWRCMKSYCQHIRDSGHRPDEL